MCVCVYCLFLFARLSCIKNKNDLCCVGLCAYMCFYLQLHMHHTHISIFISSVYWSVSRARDASISYLNIFSIVINCVCVCKWAASFSFSLFHFCDNRCNYSNWLSHTHTHTQHWPLRIIRNDVLYYLTERKIIICFLWHSINHIHKWQYCCIWHDRYHAKQIAQKKINNIITKSLPACVKFDSENKQIKQIQFRFIHPLICNLFNCICLFVFFFTHFAGSHFT